MSDASWGRKTDLNPGGVSLDASGANTVALDAGIRVAVSRIRLVTTVAHTTANATITVAKRDVDNGNSTTLGTFVLPFSGSAADDVKFVNLIEPATTGTTSSIDGSTVFTTSGKGPVYLEANQQLALTSDGGGDAGTYLVYFEGWREGFNEYETSPTPVELAFTAA